MCVGTGRKKLEYGHKFTYFSTCQKIWQQFFGIDEQLGLWKTTSCCWNSPDSRDWFYMDIRFSCFWRIILIPWSTDGPSDTGHIFLDSCSVVFHMNRPRFLNIYSTCVIIYQTLILCPLQWFWRPLLPNGLNHGPTPEPITLNGQRPRPIETAVMLHSIAARWLYNELQWTTV